MKKKFTYKALILVRDENGVEAYFDERHIKHIELEHPGAAFDGKFVREDL